ncbi:hypothetical protein M405DRAFT_828166 [Rhizopogon salebrosus TDB-379]|nr:hypothetical protein M405DRAFT_828166 [Rhizopogon salebrosus TDB-379]
MVRKHRADDSRSCLAGTQANRAYAPASSLGEEADLPCLCLGSNSPGEEASCSVRTQAYRA